MSESEIQTLTDLKDSTDSTDSTYSTNSMDLPKKIDQDFVSAPGDYDYPFYLSEKEEWVNYKKKNTKRRIIVCEPMLIMELNRLVPFLHNNYIGFHVLNMPHVIIKKIEIIGFVIAVSENARFYMYQVDDGTGTITINHDKNHFMRDSLERKAIDEKYRCNAKNINALRFRGQQCPKRFPDPRPQFNYPVGTSNRNMAILEHEWWLKTKNGLLGKHVDRCNYVHAVGYCTLDFKFGQRPRKEITFKDLSAAKLNFWAMKVTCIDEYEYNAKLLSWFNNVVCKRYNKEPDKPQITPKDAT